MYLNTLDVKLTSRKNSDIYNIRINESTLEILSLIFEFKVAASWHIARFFTQKDQDKYTYTKLRRMWQARLLESFKVYSGSVAGIPVFYVLSKKGLGILKDQGLFEQDQLRNYPQAKTLLAWSLFKHEAQVIELASMEVKNKSKNFGITFKGEIGSQSHDLISNKTIEVLTPDYTVFYKLGQVEHCIYTEFERTMKSKEATLKKIERYINYIDPENRKDKTLRFIFQTPNMEQSFWLNLLSNGASFLQKIRILTTNISLIEEHKQFLEPIYLSEKTIKLTKQGYLKTDISERTKLFSFL